MHSRPSRRSIASAHRRTSPNDALLTAVTLAVVATAVSAQRQFDPLGQGRLPAHTPNLSSDLALGDVDGDGDLDMVLVRQPSNRLYLNDGTGTFSDVTAGRLPMTNDLTSSVALGDVDADGDLDIVFGVIYRPSSHNRLFFNDGTGTFTEASAAQMPPDRANTSSVALGDVDGDGDLDMLFAEQGYVGYYTPYSSGAANKLYLNDGTGAFTSARMPLVQRDTSDLAVGDFDGDGDLDMVTANFRMGFVATGGEQNRLYLNRGNGSYFDATAKRMPPHSEITTAVAAGDVDGDGDLDLLFGNVQGHQNRLYLNNGTAVFADATARLPALSDTNALALGDVDGDGDLDMILATSSGTAGRPNRLYLNDGSGNFSDATAARMPADNDFTVTAALADVDGDGDLDQVFGNSLAQNRLYLNLLRQLDTPSNVVPGGSYVLDVYTRYGAAANGDVAYPLLSSGRASLPLPPFGILFLDPSATVPCHHWWYHSRRA